MATRICFARRSRRSSPRSARSSTTCSPTSSRRTFESTGARYDLRASYRSRMGTEPRSLRYGRAGTWRALCCLGLFEWRAASWWRNTTEPTCFARMASSLATAFRGKPDRYPHLTVKKIPKQVLARCEWGHDDYSLQVENLPKAPPKPGQQSLFEQEVGR